jgi:cytochrome c peroxidase
LKRTIFFGCLLILIIIASASFKKTKEKVEYGLHYSNGLKEFEFKQAQLLSSIQKSDLSSGEQIEKIKEQISIVRTHLKKMDFWFRYLEPISYKKINGPLPVEWETEVFEKFEKPYKREGAGLTLAALYLQEANPSKDSLLKLIHFSLSATKTFYADSITTHLNTFDHFYLCNRLFLLNLAAIYTTGFECPESSSIVPELRLMLSDVQSTYLSFNHSFPNTALSENYLNVYQNAIQFINQQPNDFEKFDHFTFIKEYVNPLFALNQKFIVDYKVVSKSYVDYSLNKNASSIFSKSLYRGQNTKGIFIRINDEKTLAEIEQLGRLLFYDPILSGNNLRSCASCHKPSQYFTDTLTHTSLQFDAKQALPRNSPTLLNSPYNHLLMLDGKHISMQDQAHAVITNSLEMACAEKDVLKKILSCEEYKRAFKQLLKYTPQSPQISMEHISSALTLYYSKFSKYYSPFDEAMNSNANIHASVKNGFNIFMSKAECATCHFAPQFNGVKPPYVGSEFEVIGVPQDKEFKNLSPDKGRYEINPAFETENAFRTGTIRNAAKTKPYMHNGVFGDLNEVIDFYDAGGGAGRGLTVVNQTLSSDSLHLTKEEKSDLLAFMQSLTEDVKFEMPPQKLPESKIKKLNTRKVGGEY